MNIAWEEGNSGDNTCDDFFFNFGGSEFSGSEFSGSEFSGSEFSGSEV